MPGTQERKDSKGGDACVGVPPCPAPVLSEDQLLVSCAELIGVPASIARLCGGEPAQRGHYGVFRFSIPSLTLDKAEAVGGAAEGIRIAVNRSRRDWGIRLLAIRGWRSLIGS